MKLLRATASDGRVFRRVGESQFHVTGTPQAPLAAPIKAMRSGRAGKSAFAYRTALVTRLTEDFPISILSADAANRWSLRQLRARCRDATRNGGIPNAYLDTLEADIIGSKGIGVHVTVQDSDADRVVTPEEQAFYKALNEGVKGYRGLQPKKRIAFRQLALECAMKATIVKTARQLEPDDVAVPGGGLDRYASHLVEQNFKEFSKRGNCDVTGKHSLMDFCRLTLRASAGDGDCLILAYLGYPNKWGVAFQLIEGDYIDDYFDCARLPNGNRVRMGIELDGFGKKVAVWVFAHHPGDYGADGVTQQGERRRIAMLGEPPDEYYSPRDKRGNLLPETVQAIHVAKSKRPEETRPVPWITPALFLIHSLEALKEAEITAAREESCKHTFYERDLFAGDGTRLEWEEDGETGELSQGVEPGGATELPPGYRVNYVDPKHPNPHFPDFLKSIKREIAMALNYCYNILFGDLEGVNFSSIRAGLQNQREGSKMTQAWFGSDCFTPIFETVLRMSLLSGALPFPVSDFDRLNQVELKFRRWPWVDPKNDAETAQLLLEMKVTTRGRIISDMSMDDFEDIEDERDDEEAYLATKKNILAADQRQADLENPRPPALESSSSSESSSPASAKALAVKSAYLGDIALQELPPEVQSTVAQFATADPTHQVARYGMTVPELLDKADQHNLDTARHRLRNAGVAASADEVRARADKHILLLNDRIIDGHHHLAKAERGKVTSSLPVLDLTPLRYQATQKKPVP